MHHIVDRHTNSQGVDVCEMADREEWKRKHITLIPNELVTGQEVKDMWKLPNIFA